MFPSISNTNPRLRVTAYCALIALLVVLAGPGAQARKPRRHFSQRPVVALQPFSLDGESRMRLAYNSPYSFPRAQAPTSEGEESDWRRGGDSRDSNPIIRGKRAVLRNGIAYAPAGAPEAVKAAIWAGNKLRRKPYVWGGGHGSFNDYGYDCSGTVSYALHHAGLLGSPIASSDFLRYGERGRGRWITIYARHGHTFAVIAGLRLDTTDFAYGGDVGPRWHYDGRNARGFSARHPAGL